ncbi:MAG: C4-type zinc ribbon domain-containing protein [Candidatus Binatia bacterium]
MPTQIELLAALQMVDQSLRDKEQAVEGGRCRVAELEEAHRTRSSETAQARETLAAASARQRDLEQRLAANEAKLKDRRMRITRIRNEKELGLAKREVDILKEESGTLETELMTVMEQVEAVTAQAAAAEEALAGITQALATEAGELRAQVAASDAEIAAERQRRASLVGALDEDLLRRYEMIFSRRGGVAVVEIRGGTCQGCNMKIPPQLFNQIQRNDQVFLCPNCQRMLYWRPERQEGARE